MYVSGLQASNLIVERWCGPDGEGADHIVDTKSISQAPRRGIMSLSVSPSNVFVHRSPLRCVAVREASDTSLLTVCTVNTTRLRCGTVRRVGVVRGRAHGVVFTIFQEDLHPTRRTRGACISFCRLSNTYVTPRSTLFLHYIPSLLRVAWPHHTRHAVRDISLYLSLSGCKRPIVVLPSLPG